MNTARIRVGKKFPKSLPCPAGVYFFDRVIHDAIACIQPSARGKITDAIQCLIDQQKEWQPVAGRLVVEHREKTTS